MEAFQQVIRNIAKASQGRVAFPESMDLKILQAINLILRDEALAEVLVFAPRAEIMKKAKAEGLRDILAKPERLVCFAEDRPKALHELVPFLREQMKSRPWTDLVLKELASSPLYQAGYALANGYVDAALAGVATVTSDVIRCALRTIGKAKGVNTISGSFIMEKDQKLVLFADCAVCIEPSVDDLVDIAEASVRTWRSIPFLAKEEARVAFLSFSSKGSAKSRQSGKMESAAEQMQSRFPNVLVDGELQFDAAFDPDIGSRKASGSRVAGRANIFIFPDLDAGNIAYKIAQHMGGFSAYGPILQGLAKPYSDLSRGASVHDIIVSTYINILRAKNHKAEGGGKGQVV